MNNTSKISHIVKNYMTPIEVDMYTSYVLSQIDTVPGRYSILSDSVNLPISEEPLFTGIEFGSKEYIKSITDINTEIQKTSVESNTEMAIKKYQSSDAIYCLTNQLSIDTKEGKIVDNKMKIISNSFNFIKSFLMRDFKEVFRLVVLKGETQNPIYRISPYPNTDILMSRLNYCRDIVNISTEQNIIPSGFFPRNESLWSIQELNIRFPKLTPIVSEDIIRIGKDLYCQPIVILDDSEIKNLGLSLDKTIQ